MTLIDNILTPDEHLLRHKHNKLHNLEWSEAGHIIDSNIIPFASGTIDLGSISFAFDNAYIDKVYLEADPTDLLGAATKKYVDNISSYTIGVSMDGGGSAISTGIKGFVTIPEAGTITEWYLTGDISTTSVIDVWVAAGAIPTDADSITNGHEPSLSADTVASDTNVDNWSDTSMAKGDVAGFNLDSNDAATFLSLVIVLEKSNP